MSICSQCAKNIEFCYEFINTCKTTDAALKSYREEKLTDSIKEEDDVPIKEELLELTYHDDNSSQHYDDNNTRDNEEDIKLKVEFDDIEDDETLDKLAAKKFKKASGKADKFVKKNLKQLRKEYKCPVCEIMIIGKRKFNFHLTERHEEYKKYVCPHCKKGYIYCIY